MERLAALALGELGEADRERLGDHIVGCRRCSESWRILSRTHAQASRATGAARAWRPWAAAAAIALVALAAVWTVRTSGRREAFRGAASVPAGDVIPADGTTIGDPPAVLRWPMQREAQTHRVRLFTSAGDPLWEADAGKSREITVPESVRARLRPEQAYFWTVDVGTPAGTERLGPFAFTLHR